MSSDQPAGEQSGSPVRTGDNREAVAVLCTCALVASAAAWAAQVTNVAPGSVVRWPGETIEECVMDSRSWPPLAGECWFAIDLLRPEGPLRVGRWRQGRFEENSLRVMPYPYEVQRITLEDDSQVNLSAKDLQRVERENQLIEELWRLETPRRFSLPLTPPLDPLPTAGRFGARRFFNDQPRSPHSGADFEAAAGTPVLAVADGTVALTGEFFFAGRSVFVDHGDGLISMYFHLSQIAVAARTEVERGGIVGKVGRTGRATGPHLHFAVRWHRARIDPMQLFTPDSVPAMP